MYGFHRHSGLVEGDLTCGLQHLQVLVVVLLVNKPYKIVYHIGVGYQPIACLFVFCFQQRPHLDSLCLNRIGIISPCQVEVYVYLEDNAERSLALYLPWSRTFHVERQVYACNIPTAHTHAHTCNRCEYEAERIELEQGIEARIAMQTESLPTYIDVQPRTYLEGVTGNGKIAF